MESALMNDMYTCKLKFGVQIELGANGRPSSIEAVCIFEKASPTPPSTYIVHIVCAQSFEQFQPCAKQPKARNEAIFL